MHWFVRACIAGAASFATILIVGYFNYDIFLLSSGWTVLLFALKFVSFMLIYDLLDLRFGSPIRCSFCGMRHPHRLSSRCTSCGKSLGLSLSSVSGRMFLLIAGIFALITLLGDVSTVWYYATSRWYFCVGPSSIFLHRGWHTPGSGFREQAPDLAHPVIWIPLFLTDNALRGEIFITMGALLLWRKWTSLLVRIRRKRPSSLCTCGYDLTGNVSGICPECGSPVRSSGQAEPTNND